MKMLLFFFGSLMLCSCGPDKYPISFHMETGATDSKKFAFERDGHYYSKAPFISHKDIESYYSFPAPDNTYGIVVNVRKGLGSRVEGITAANLGRQILPIVNGHTLIAQSIEHERHLPCKIADKISTFSGTFSYGCNLFYGTLFIFISTGE